MILTQIDLVALLCIVMIGVPHGALDINLSLSASDSPKSRWLYYSSYILLAVASFWLWSLFPTTSLMLFLAISTHHFGRSNPFGLNAGRVMHRWELFSLQLFMGGVATLYIPALYWPQVQLLFESLGADSAVFSVLGRVVLPLWVGSAIVSVFILRNLRVAFLSLSLCAVLAMKEALSPLILFSFYFCVLHSASHFFRAMRFLRAPVSSPPPMFLINTAIAWIFVLAAYGYYAPYMDSSAAGLNAIFGVLFALTIPHMFLIDGLLPRAAHYWQANFIGL